MEQFQQAGADVTRDNVRFRCWVASEDLLLGGLKFLPVSSSKKKMQSILLDQPAAQAPSELP
jgi:hypothetical protein